MSIQIQLEAIAKYPVATIAGRDFKAWAKRILYRHEHGDKDLTTIQVRFAQEAMGVNQQQETA